jgi:hypothetical protein
MMELFPFKGAKSEQLIFVFMHAASAKLDYLRSRSETGSRDVFVPGKIRAFVPLQFRGNYFRLHVSHLLFFLSCLTD